MSERHDAYLAQIARIKETGQISQVVEAGCGPGILAAAVASLGLAVHAFDTSAEMREMAERTIAAVPTRAPYSVRAGDIESIPFRDAQFDLYISAGVIEYLKTDSIALAEAHRVLRPSGHLIISSTNRLSPIGTLDGIVEWAKRRPWLLTIANRCLVAFRRPPVRPRHFKVRQHIPSTLRRNVEAAGFVVTQTGFFFFLPWPHPLDRFFPFVSSAMADRLRFLSRTPFKWLGEGYFVVARKTSLAP